MDVPVSSSDFVFATFCEQFGLTPSARSRIVADTVEDKESDEMELLLIKGGGR